MLAEQLAGRVESKHVGLAGRRDGSHDDRAVSRHSGAGTTRSLKWASTASCAILPSLPPAALRHGQTFVKSYFAALPERERASFGNNAWRAWFALEAARAFEPAELRRLHAALADIDIRMKSSRLEPADLLFSFLLEACAAPGRGNAQLS